LLWGAPRIQGELLKLGFTVAQSTVAKYMVKRDDTFSRLICLIKARSSALTGGRPPRARDFQRQ